MPVGCAVLPGALSGPKDVAGVVRQLRFVRIRQVGSLLAPLATRAVGTISSLLVGLAPVNVGQQRVLVSPVGP